MINEINNVLQLTCLNNSFKSRDDADTSLLANQFALNFISHCLHCSSIGTNEFHTSLFLLLKINRRVCSVCKENGVQLPGPAGLVISILNLPDGQTKFFGGIQITEEL